MCFYDQLVFNCGDWKWGHFKKHCQKEYRMGETCGSRFIYNTTYDQNKCATCLSLDKKHRRYEKAEADYNRWIHDSQRQCSAAKARDEMMEIRKEIQKLTAERQARYTNIGSNRRPQ